MGNENVVKIVGVKVTPSKKVVGAYGYTYYFTQPFDDYAKSASEVYGLSCGSEYSGTDIGCKVGDEVELKYRKGWEGKAQLVGCEVIKPANTGK